MTQIAILTPAAADPAYKSHWPVVLERLSKALAMADVTVVPTAWTDHVEDASGLMDYPLVLGVLTWGYYERHSDWLAATKLWGEAGVRIFEYEPSMMHAKTVVVDGSWSLVGSANLDERSMEINEENLMGIADADFARSIEEGIEADLARSHEVQLEEWRKRPFHKKLFERACLALIEQY